MDLHPTEVSGNGHAVWDIPLVSGYVARYEMIKQLGSSVRKLFIM